MQLNGIYNQSPLVQKMVQQFAIIYSLGRFSFDTGNELYCRPYR